MKARTSIPSAKGVEVLRSPPPISSCPAHANMRRPAPPITFVMRPLSAASLSNARSIA